MSKTSPPPRKVPAVDIDVGSLVSAIVGSKFEQGSMTPGMAPSELIPFVGVDKVHTARLRVSTIEHLNKHPSLHHFAHELFNLTSGKLRLKRRTIFEAFKRVAVGRGFVKRVRELGKWNAHETEKVMVFLRGLRNVFATAQVPDSLREELKLTSEQARGLV